MMSIHLEYVLCTSDVDIMVNYYDIKMMLCIGVYRNIHRNQALHTPIACCISFLNKTNVKMEPTRSRVIVIHICLTFEKEITAC